MAKKIYKGKDKFGISRWCFDWKDYFTGKRHRKTYAMTEQEAEAKRQKLESLEMCRHTGIILFVFAQLNAAIIDCRYQ